MTLAADLRAALTTEPPWRPNPGPQSAFMASSAFEVLYGGAAGGGKSEALLQKALCGVHDSRYNGILFRRNFPDLDKSLIPRSRVAYRKAYPGAVYNDAKHVWTFPSGARIHFSHLEYDKNVYDHQSAEYQFIGFDELTHFTEWQYTYLLSRARSSFGMQPVIRAATNPGGPGHEWVMRRWGPWLDPKNDVHAEPSEVLRYRSDGDGERWASDGQLSRTFIPARLSDTPQLSGTGYDHQFGAMDPVTRAQLLGGDWLIQPAAGLYFQRAWFTYVDAMPPQRSDTYVQRVRFWDKAATAPHEGNRDPDWTAGVKLARIVDDYYVEHVERFREGPGEVEKRIRAVAESDGRHVGVRMAQDPGSAGKSEAAAYVRLLEGWDIQTARETGDKVTRAKAVSAQCSPQSTGGAVGRVSVVRGPWVDAFIAELEAFPEGNHDDQVDAFSGAFNALADGALRIRRPKTSSGGRWGDGGRGW